MESRPKLRNLLKLYDLRFNDEGVPTVTSEEQMKVEDNIELLFEKLEQHACLNPSLPKLYRWQHMSFLQNSLRYLPVGYQSLDSSRTWLCYWILHSISLLDYTIPDDVQTAIVKFLAKCQCVEGGFAGGPNQLAHLAPTYAAVNALCIIGTREAYEVIDREGLYRFLKSVRSSEGSYAMHVGGENDIRGVYCALAVASLTNIFTEELFDRTAEWIVSCQTYEGGFSGCHGMEAHGGYTFCGLAALVLLGKVHLCDTQALLRWSSNRQMKFEGGFQGRTNKLVDGCYSFWQGAVFPLIHPYVTSEDEETITPSKLLFDEEALQIYILTCCQNPSGGLIDKPGKRRDLYHTCYALSGLSLTQNSNTSEDICLAPTHPVYNIIPQKVSNARYYFRQLPSVGVK